MRATQVAWQRRAPAELQNLALMIGLAPFYESGNRPSGLVGHSALLPFCCLDFLFGTMVSCWALVGQADEPVVDLAPNYGIKVSRQLEVHDGDEGGRLPFHGHIVRGNGVRLQAKTGRISPYDGCNLGQYFGTEPRTRSPPVVDLLYST